MVHNAQDHPEGLSVEAVEAGRLLFAAECVFVAASMTVEALPPEHLPEVCFAGRSNVGKSSLVNALCGRRALARTSQTPGRTRQLVFFSLASRLQLVDLPGYGYAKVSKSEAGAWTKLTKRFLVGRASLRRVFLLIDARRGIGAGDMEIMAILDASAVSWAAVLTKADKLKPGLLDETVTATRAAISKHVAAYPELFVTSSQKGEGIETLRAHIAGLALPRG